MRDLLATLDTLQRELDATEAAANMMVYLSWRTDVTHTWLRLCPCDADVPEVFNVQVGWAMDTGNSFCIEAPGATVQVAAA